MQALIELAITAAAANAINFVDAVEFESMLILKLSETKYSTRTTVH